MDSHRFFCALIAAIRAVGVTDLAFVPDAFQAGVKAALAEASKQRVKLAFSTGPTGLLSRHLVANRLLTNPNPTYERIHIELSSPSAAEQILQNLVDRPDSFKKVANAFLRAFHDTTQPA